MVKVRGSVRVRFISKSRANACARSSTRTVFRDSVWFKFRVRTLSNSTAIFGFSIRSGLAFVVGLSLRL
jgi:hypothetical protein